MLRSINLSVIIGAAILGLAIMVSAFLFSRTDFIITTAGGGNGSQIINAINVAGEGKIFAKPDMATLSVTVAATANTSQAALDEANTNINKARTAIKANGVADEDIQTSSLQLMPEYDYTNGEQRLKGQRASQTLNVKLKKLDDKATRLATLIDQLSAINKIQIGGIVFDVENRAAVHAQAREMAIKSAKAKAEQLANLSGVELLQPISISDSANSSYPSVNYVSAEAPRAANGGSNVTIAPGQLEYNITVNVAYGIK